MYRKLPKWFSWERWQLKLEHTQKSPILYPKICKRQPKMRFVDRAMSFLLVAVVVKGPLKANQPSSISMEQDCKKIARKKANPCSSMTSCPIESKTIWSTSNDVRFLFHFHFHFHFHSTLSTVSNWWQPTNSQNQTHEVMYTIDGT